jgi:hypothetical protein
VASQTIVWVTLPNGFNPASSRARLSVFVAPRLRPDQPPTLGGPPFDFVDWPARCAPDKIEFDVVFSGVRVRADIVSQPNSDRWKALFPPDTFVRAYQSDATSGIFGSYPAAQLHDDLKAAYREVGANSPLNHPAPDVVTRAFANVPTLFAPAAGDFAVDPGLSDADNRIRLAAALFRPSRTESSPSLVDELVDLARHEAEQSLAANGRTKFVPIVPPTGDAANRFVQLAVFHQQPAGTVAPRPLAASDTNLDFHQMLSALGEYPRILRELGLVIDLEIGLNDVPEAEIDAPALVHVVPRFVVAPTHATDLVTPSTKYICTRGQVFAAAPRVTDNAPPEIIGRFLNLGSGQFRIVQVDVDSAGLRALDLLGRIGSARSDSEPAALSALRTSGLSITRESHAELLHDILANGFQSLSEPGTGESVTLFADDLVRGYRIDVQGATSGQWRSLHDRAGTYTFGDLTAKLDHTDEGCVQPSVVQPVANGSAPAATTHDASAANYVPESLFVWQGWSLAVPRPGTPLAQPALDTPQIVEPPPESRLKLKASFNVPAQSLPRLRFGERYKLRARTVDLAGNGLKRTEANDVSDPPILPPPGESFTFLRFEPVVSPTPVFRSRPREGESIDRIILRSNDGITPEAFAAAHPEYLLANERHIAPPKTAQLIAEMFGLFDASIGTGANAAQTYAIAGREQGSLSDGALPPEPSDNGDDASSDPVHPESALKITYLPDPLAAGVTFWNLPGMPERRIGRTGDNGLAITDLPLGQASEIKSLVLVDFGPASAWPDLRPFRLRLSEGAGQPSWSAAERVLTVFLPKGEASTVRMSCFLRDDALRLLGVWAWISESLAGSEEQRQLATLGLLWMLTPYRELTLVHAVPQPAEAPSTLSFPPPLRRPNQTFAWVGGRVRLHGGSTGRVALTARWQEFVDDAAAETVLPREVKAQVFDAPLPLSGIPAGGIETATISFDAQGGVLEYLAPQVASLEASIRQSRASLVREINDFRQDALSVPDLALRTTLRKIADDWRNRAAKMLDLVGFPTRWPALVIQADDLAIVAPFPEDDPHFDSIPDNIKADAISVGFTAQNVSDTTKSALDTLDRFLGVRHQFGDTKHRKVSYRPIATSRFSECFAPNIVGSATREGDVQTVHVVSSAPPLPPRIQYIVPAFSWTRTPLDPTQPYTSQRRGALRVYLDRPWYSSGEGELLGVALASTSSSTTDPFVTHWGRDPLWQSRPLPNPERPTPDAFRNPVLVVPGVSLHQEDLSHLAGDPAALVTVVGHDVTIADGRCFCDIEIDPGASYYPFVRLALVRFQPNSLKDSELSRVAIADFMQIAPTRSVAVVRSAADRLDVTVSGTTHQTPTDPINPGAQTGTQIRLSAQKRIEFATDDAGWLPAGGGVVVSPVVAVATGDILWQGTVTVPTGPARGQLRLLIEELELHKGVDPTPVSRVVFAETFFVDLLAPIFATFDPGRGGPGTIVNLRGGNFNLSPVSVQFGDRTAEIEGTPSATLIKAKVPTGFTAQSAVKIKITTAGGSVVSSSTFTVIPSPVFRAFDPGTGAQGTVVNLRGDNFNFAPVAVQFGDRTADIDGAPTATLIKAKVPTGFTAQSPVKIRITTAGGTVVSSSDFTVLIPPPMFRAFDPGTGRPGTVVNLRGDNFNFAPVSVRFGGKLADIDGAPTATLIKAKVPAGFTAQSRVKIRIATAGGSVVSTSDFVVVIPPPVFRAFDPGTGRPGTVVNLRGDNFDLAPVAVQFGDRTAEIEGTPTATLIKAKVPTGFTAQSRVKIRIATAGGSVVSTSDFVVTPP